MAKTGSSVNVAFLLPTSLLLLTAFLHNVGFASAAHGKATYYTPPFVPSACFGFDEGQFPTNQMFAAASNKFWDGGAVCGDWYWVWCESHCTNTNPILVRIVDNCPKGCTSSIDLSETAFKAIANTDTGIIDVRYEFAYSG